MSRIEHYTAEFVETFPSPMRPGVLYVSTTYSTAGHLCPCGCEREVVTKLSPARWKVIFDGEVSMRPSVAASGLPCNSHYFITRGGVDWHRKLDADEQAETRALDRKAVEAHRLPAVLTSPASSRWWKRLWRRSDR